MNADKNSFKLEIQNKIKEFFSIVQNPGNLRGSASHKKNQIKNEN